jgi:hypothetical protein
MVFARSAPISTGQFARFLCAPHKLEDLLFPTQHVFLLATAWGTATGYQHPSGPRRGCELSEDACRPLRRARLATGVEDRPCIRGTRPEAPDMSTRSLFHATAADVLGFAEGECPTVCEVGQPTKNWLDST